MKRTYEQPVPFRNKRGAALLIVLFITMAVTIASLGFLARSDAELACGDNLALRLKMDNLARCALMYGRAFVMNYGPATISSPAAQPSETGGADYWKLTFAGAPATNPVDPNLFSGTTTYTYSITAEGYRLINSVKVARSSLQATILYVNDGGTKRGIITSIKRQ
jgi:type II secretory pathway component PulK